MAELEILNKLQSEEESTLVLFDDNNNEVEFAVCASIPDGEDLYAILKPITKIDEVAEDEAVVFKYGTDDEQQELLEVVTDDNLADRIFALYLEMIK